MTCLDDLPTEILSRVAANADSRSDIANLRLVNRRMNAIAVEHYYAAVALYAHWWSYENELDSQPDPNDAEYDAKSFRNILESDYLKRLVKKVAIYTCNPDCDHHPAWSIELCYGNQVEFELDEAWHECYNRLAEFPNLRSVVLCFDRHGCGNDTSAHQDILTGSRERRGELHNVLRLFGDRIKELGIRHFEERFENDFREDEEKREDEALRVRVLGGISSLRLSIVHEQSVPESGSTLKVCDNHSFWQRFPQRWLQPTTQTLKRLVLYSDLPVGWFPKLDLRRVFFPHLQSLALGQFMFSHDWQFDWIFSHAPTLKEMYFDHCSILYQIGHSNEFWLDDGGFPQKSGYLGWGYSFDPGRFPDTKHPVFVSYSERWQKIFARFAKEMPHLVEFRFGSSDQWNFDTEHRYPCNPGKGLPIMPWEAEHAIKNELFDGMYLLFDDWGADYRGAWSENEELDFSDTADWPWKPEWIAQMESPPGCKKEDKAALDALLWALKM